MFNYGIDSEIDLDEDEEKSSGPFPQIPCLGESQYLARLRAEEFQRAWSHCDSDIKVLPLRLWEEFLFNSATFQTVLSSLYDATIERIAEFVQHTGNQTDSLGIAIPTGLIIGMSCLGMISSDVKSDASQVRIKRFREQWYQLFGAASRPVKRMCQLRNRHSTPDVIFLHF